MFPARKWPVHASSGYGRPGASRGSPLTGEGMAPNIALSPVALTLISAGCVILLALVTAWRLARTVAEERAAVRKQREELVHASRLAIVGELTASLAHEINQPLGAILSNADAAELLLERDAPPLDEIRQILADIRRDGLRASGVIVQVRKLVRRREIEFDTVESD